MNLPILWSFRRCPYAMRARLAVASSAKVVELREILLRDKPAAFLAASESGTVPCLEDGETRIDESLDIMLWALGRSDPERWLDMPDLGFDLIGNSDGPFKTALDRYKYASRHSGVDPEAERLAAGKFLLTLNTMLENQVWLFGDTPRLADMAILPFVRQFAHVDLDWFTAQPWPEVHRWLDNFKSSERFQNIMRKYPTWSPDAAPQTFP